MLLAQEARRKGVHVLLAPTVNLHRSPLGGRHFEAYSEDPYLTGRIGAGYVTGVQAGGVGTTVKHFVANDAETDRFTVNNLISQRALRELYLAPFEHIVENAHPWGVMTAYNTVNGTTMSEHRHLVNEVLRGEWGFDGFNVSDWTAARSTVGTIEGGLDVAMPGPKTVYGEALAQAVRDGEVEEAAVDAAVRNVLRLAARVGILEGAEPVVTEDQLPSPSTERPSPARSPAAPSSSSGTRTTPCRCGPAAPSRSSAPPPVTPASSAAAPPSSSRRTSSRRSTASPPPSPKAPSPTPSAPTRTPNSPTPTRGSRCAPSAGTRRARSSAAPTHPADSFAGWVTTSPRVSPTTPSTPSNSLGTFTPRETGEHTFGIKGLGAFTLAVDGTTYYDDVQRPVKDDPFGSFFGSPEPRARVELTAAAPRSRCP